MAGFVQLSDEADKLLKEILKYENNGDYWAERFNNLSSKEDTILRGCFKELKDNQLITVMWADNIPYYIKVLKDGYLYEQNKQQEKETGMSPFETELNDLLERAKTIKAPINAAPISVSISDYNKPSEEWLNDAEIFFNKYLRDHSLNDRMKRILFHRQLSAYRDMLSCLTSVSKDQEYIDEKKGIQKDGVSMKNNNRLEYDVFISHANKDKEELVEKLYNSLEWLGINIYYDKKTHEWGDRWKEKILEGTRRSEFAIIVISRNFFGREWTEKELAEFMNRQNQDGQKIVLPILHNISIEQLESKYPELTEIQCISSEDYTCDQIALMFANQLIKRLKMTN